MRPNTYIAPQATDKVGIVYSPWAKPAHKQPHAALVYRFIVSTLIIHVITWFTTRLPTQNGWKAELAWLSE